MRQDRNADTKATGKDAAGRGRTQDELRVGLHQDVDEYRARALERIARETVNRIEERRDVARLREAGMNQRDVAAKLATTQPRVGRIERAIELLGDPFEVTAEEIILLAHLSGSDRAELVEQLSDRRYTESEYAPYPAEGKRSGTWEQVRNAHMSGFISEDEFAEVRRRRTLQPRE